MVCTEVHTKIIICIYTDTEQTNASRERERGGLYEDIKV